MKQKKQNEELPQEENLQETTAEEQTNLQDNASNEAEIDENSANVTDETAALQKKYNELNDSHLRLMAEFDNYRKRTLREKAELIKTGSESTLSNLLPIIDDFERALQMMKSAEDVKAVQEGVELIYSKFMGFLAQQGVKPIEAIGKTFDTEACEAIATIPAPEEDLKGKIIDCVQTGYTLHDKVIRHAKVVVGE